MKLGQKVQYIRQRPDGAIEEGEGVIHSFAFDAHKRRTVHLNIGGEGINVNLAAVNPSEDFKAKFRDMCVKVQKEVDECNAKQKVLVAKYNKRIDKLNNAVLGRPIEIETMPKKADVKPTPL